MYTHMLRLRFGIALLAALLIPAAPALAQAGAEALAQQSLRPYRLVFVAYALAWLLIMGWIVSIGRRIRKLENGREGE